MLLLYLIYIPSIGYTVLCPSGILPIADLYKKFEDDQLTKFQIQGLNVGFLVWIKRQPLSAINQIPLHSAGSNFLQIIYQTEVKETEQKLFLLFLNISEPMFNLQLKSDFFESDKQFSIKEEGIWIYFQSFFDNQQEITIFIFYNSLTQQSESIEINRKINFNGSLTHIIGGVCESCTIQNIEYTFWQFKGRITNVVISNVLITQLEFNQIEQDCYQILNGCDKTVDLLISGGPFEGQNFLTYQMPVMEKQIYQLQTWFQVSYNKGYDLEVTVFRISNNYNEISTYYNKAVFLIYKFSTNIEETQFCFNSLSKESFSNGEFSNYTLCQKGIELSTILQEWHYLILDVGNNDKVNLIICSFKLEQPISKSLPCNLYTGVQNYIFIGGNYLSQNYLLGEFNHLILQTFCEFYEYSIPLTCHKTCLTCNGPYYFNCLTCRVEDSRVLTEGNQCLCNSDTILFETSCETVDKIFGMLKVVEEEIFCEQEGYDICDEDGNIICSFGYFIYNNNCIKWYYISCYNSPHFDELQNNQKILCFECITSPNYFTLSLLCETDSIVYNNNPLYNFIDQIRTKELVEQYKMEVNEQGIYQLRLMQNFLSKQTCKPGFFELNDECKQCPVACLKCSNEDYCFQCNTGYYLSSEQICLKSETCLTLVIVQGNLNCLTCLSQYYLNQNSQCIACGLYCASCRSNGFCNYCIDSQKYFISLDGINCKNCKIENCKYCYQIKESNNQIITSYDLYLEKREINQVQGEDEIEIQCSKCSEGYVLDIENNICKQKEELFKSCLFGKLQNSEFICLFQENECIKFQNCKTCSNEKCYECQDGYYSDYLSNLCRSCPNECKKCVQYNKEKLMYWKWEIMPFYDYISQSFSFSHSFYQCCTSNLREDYSFICTVCDTISNYLLTSNFTCKMGCDSNCQTCRMIDDQPVCIQCKSQSQGIPKSLEEYYFIGCQKCPKNCAACTQRHFSDSYELNQYFESTSSSRHYQKSCYQPYETNDGSVSSMLQNIVIRCRKYKKCQQKLVYQWNLYCDFQQFINLDQDNSHLLSSHHYLKDFFSESIFHKTETKNLYGTFNDMAISQIDHYINFYQGEAEECITYNFLEFDSFSLQNIFSLKNVNIYFVGKDKQVLFGDSTYFYISGFTKISFQNLHLQQGNVIVPSVETREINIKFFSISSQYQSDLFFKFYFQFKNMVNLNIENLEISNVHQTFEDIFSFVINNNNELKLAEIKVTNLKILNCVFKNLNIFYVQKSFFLNQLKLLMNNVEILSTQFENGCFIKTEGDQSLNLKLDDFIVQDLSFKNIETKFKSILFSLPNVNKFVLTNAYFDTIYTNNFDAIIQCNQFVGINILLQRVRFWGNFFTNQVEQYYQTSLTGQIKITLYNVSLSKSNYNSSQSFFQVITYHDCVTIINITLLTIKSTILDGYSNLNLYFSQDTAFMHFDCQTCIFDQLLIERTISGPEISILNSQNVLITNSIFTQNKDYIGRIMYPSFNCYQSKHSASEVQMMYFIFIGQFQNVTIDNLQILDAITFNTPFVILLQSHQIMQAQQDEYIEIINSKFENNMLLVTGSSTSSSIISITSEQTCYAQFMNLTFINNHLNIFVQDLNIHSSTLLMIQLQQGTLVLNNNIIKQNLITNSSDSILYLSASEINISNTIFQTNNKINFTNFFYKIIFEASIKIQYVYESDLQKYFLVKSKGGNGYFLTNKFYLNNVIVIDSFSEMGGSFYINSFGDSIISIDNSTFQSTIAALLSTSASYGGCLYIDAYVSKLTLIIQDSRFTNVLSRYSGGAIYVDPSTSYNSINIVNVSIIDCYSIQSSFLDFLPTDLNGMTSNILIKNIKIIQTLNGLKKFLSLLDSFSDDEANNILNNNPLFFVQYSNITFQNCTLNSQTNVFFASLNYCYQIMILDTEIYNSTISNSPIIKMTMKQDNLGQILIQNLKLQNLSKLKAINITDKCHSINAKQSIVFTCKNPNFREKQFIQLIENIKEIQNNQQICNWYSLQNTEKVNFSLIQITLIQKSHFIVFDQVLIANVACSNCSQGILSMVQIETLKQNNIQLKNVKIKDSNCGIYGCVAIINQADSQSLKSSILNTNTRRILSIFNIEKLHDTMNYQILIENSQFNSNTAKYGGALCIVGVDIVISQSFFFNNTAQQGGAIFYVKNESQIILLTTKVSANSAKIAGGLFLYDTQLNLGNDLDLLISDNNSTLAGNDILEKPRSLALSVDGGFTLLQKKTLVNSTSQIIEQTLVNPYKILGYSQKAETLTLPSGTSIGTYQYFDLYSQTIIPYNLTFRVIALNSKNEREKKLDGTLCTLKHKVVNITSHREINDQFASLSFQQIQFNQTSSDYNFDDLILRIFITCEAIRVPIYSNEPPFEILKQITDYQLVVDIKTFPCQLGQYFNTTSGLCIQCNAELSQYQVELNATICQFRDETTIVSVESQMIELKPTYWRAYFYSSKIEQCYHLLENCNGGWKPGDNSCTLGHIGALCEQCDLYNTRGDGEFSMSSPYKCGSCTIISGNIISIVVISIWTLISVLMSVSSTIQMIKKFLAGNRLAAFGVFIAIKDSSTAVLIKVFTNYIQIITSITTFQLKVPPELSSSFSSVGNPIEQMAFSLDCFLVGLSDISIIYFRIIWSLLITFSYIIAFFILLGGGLLLKKFVFNVSMITTALIYIFIFLQPNIIQALISLVSFRRVSDITWVQGNVSYRYDSSSHIHWIFSFCLPLLLIFSIGIPLLMFYGVHHSKKKLDSIQVRETWGYLYNEYKLHAYYWEFIKIIQKEFIIIVLSYYEDQIPIKASLVFLFIFAYSFLTTSVSPYMTGELNQLDIQSTTVCAVSIILGSSIYTAFNNNLMEIVYPFYAIIIILNFFFILKMIIKIALAYFDKLHESIDKFKELITAKFGEKLKDHPRILKILETSKTKESRIKKRFAQLKSYLIPEARKILKLKQKYQEAQSKIKFLLKPITQPVEEPAEQIMIQIDISSLEQDKNNKDQ